VQEDDAPSKIRREILLKVYAASLDECRFNVQLSWDRTKFFLLLNSALIAAGVGLLKTSEHDALQCMFLVVYFLLGIAVCAFGLESAKVGKGYYREAIFTKTVVEKQLGLLDPLDDPPEANLSIAVTKGQRDYRRLLAEGSNPDAPISKTTNTGYLILVFWVMILINSLGAVASAIGIGLALPK
jgi:hypothetical protein